MQTAPRTPVQEAGKVKFEYHETPYKVKGQLNPKPWGLITPINFIYFN
jgi:hypothetical protein